MERERAEANRRKRGVFYKDEEKEKSVRQRKRSREHRQERDTANDDKKQQMPIHEPFSSADEEENATLKCDPTIGVLHSSAERGVGQGGEARGRARGGKQLFATLLQESRGVIENGFSIASHFTLPEQEPSREEKEDRERVRKNSAMSNSVTSMHAVNVHSGLIRTRKPHGLRHSHVHGRHYAPEDGDKRSVSDVPSGLSQTRHTPQNARRPPVGVKRLFSEGNLMQKKSLSKDYNKIDQVDPDLLLDTGNNEEKEEEYSGLSASGISEKSMESTTTSLDFLHTQEDDTLDNEGETDHTFENESISAQEERQAKNDSRLRTLKSTRRNGVKKTKNENEGHRSPQFDKERNRY